MVLVGNITRKMGEGNGGRQPDEVESEQRQKKKEENREDASKKGWVL